MKKGLILLGISTLVLMGCDNANKNDELKLFRNSNAYIEVDTEVNSFPLKTYNRKGEGNVPYVSLKEFLPIVKLIDRRNVNKENRLDYSNNNGVYTINYACGDDEPISHPFVFNKNNNTITINKEARAFYHLFYDSDPNIDTMGHLYKSVKEKDKDYAVSDNRVIDLNKYDLKIIEKDNDLFAPIDLYQVIFKMSAAPSGNNHIAYNGIDYFGSRGTSVVASCYSSSLKFDLQDPNVLISVLRVRPAISTETSFSFSPVTPGNNEKYRFECPVIEGKEVTVISTSEIVNVPDFYVRITLDNNGSGRYVYINNTTKEEFFNADIGLEDNKTLSYTEDNDYINLNVTYPNAFIPNQTQVIASSINKNKTFYLEEERTKEYALYDYKIISLYLGEFYGLVESNPKVRDSINFLKQYKDEILSPNYHDYHLAVSKMALEGIDDGHTKVLGFSKFTEDDFESGDNQKALDEMTGPRRGGILKYVALAEGYRASHNIKQGYEVVGDTAYLAFDSFSTVPMAQLDSYTNTPDSYVESDTIGFAYKAMQDVASNHQEVKRVVFDLSCNTGGMVIAMPFLLGLMKKDFHINSYNYYVNDMCQRNYQLDLNANGVFGEDEDTYEGKYDFYVLTSPASFSCGNAFPGAAKYNKAAKIIGKQSAGGASGVDYFTTPCGFDLRCSSPMTEAFELEDGVFIENDKGIPVDYEISEEYWYNRTQLNALLDEIEAK